MQKFKVGDKVEVVKRYDEYEVGEVGIVTRISVSSGKHYCRINDDIWGAPADFFKKVEDKPMFKIGDKVKVTKRNEMFFGRHGLDIGGVYKIVEKYSHDGFRLKSVGKAKDNYANYVHEEEVEMYVEESDFEDQWHLNDGKVEIPGDADKLEKDGSVVAFRYRKVKPFEFGEKLRIKKSLWPKDIIDPNSINPGFDYVDAVYICKYFDLDDKEGIRVYINNGEKSWDCCFTDLDKVERLT